MAITEIPLVLSAMDCACLLDKADPFDAAGEDDCDCACPADLPPSPGEAARHSASLDTPYLCTDELYSADLDDSLSLVFDPQGRYGVVVLDRAARDLLAAFAQPQPLARVAPQQREAAGRLLRLDLIAPAGSPRRPALAESQTLSAWLHVIGACNLSCDYCYAPRSSEAMSLERGRQAVEAVFRSATLNGFRQVKLKYAGGEASLNLPLVAALHEHALALAAQTGLGLRGVLLSNGAALDDVAIDQIGRLGLRVVISLDGVGAVHDAQRSFAGGRGSFSKVERALDRLAAHSLPPSLTITLTARNLVGLSEVVDYALERNLPFTINFYRKHGRAVGHRDLAFTEVELVAAMRAAFTRIAAHPPRRSLLGALADRARLDVPHGLPCGAGHSYLVIDQRGGVAACHMAIEQTVAQISAVDPLAAVRASATGVRNPHVDDKEGCRACPWRYQCAGGCPALTYHVTGRFDTRSPNCSIYQSLFPDLLRLEAGRILAYSGVAPYAHAQ